MTHRYDPAQTSMFFQENFELFNLYETEIGPSSRDRILLERILPGIPAAGTSLIDYGCGAGGLLTSLAEKGYDALGIEPNASLRQLAIRRLQRLGLASKHRVLHGGLDLLSSVDPHTIDLVVAMGVFQYLSEDEYTSTLKAVLRALKPNGHLVCTFQNALFDLFTFNKYTVDFFEHHLLPPLAVLGLDLEKAVAGIRSLITHPDAPQPDKSRARDSIFVRLSNPLTIKTELRTYGFELEGLYFYTLHPVPPLIKQDQRDRVDTVSQIIEVDKAQEWYGHFIGNAFLTHCRPQLKSADIRRRDSDKGETCSP